LTAKLSARKFAIGGVFWPSMIFPEANDSQGAAQSIGERDTIGAKEQLQALKVGQNAENQRHIDDMIAVVAAGADNEQSQLKLAASLLQISNGLPVHDDNEFRKAFSNATPTSVRTALQAGDSLQ